jgi:site-specific recombinase XerD
MQVILRADGAIACSFFFSINTGARVSEALSVRVRDAQRDIYRAVQLLGRGRKQRTVTPLGELLSTSVLG